MNRTLLVSMFLAAIVALAPQRARADEVSFLGITSSTSPSGITFAPGSFSGTTSGGFANFSNLGAYTLSSAAGTYTNDTLALTVVFTLPSGIAGGGSTSFTANLFGSVNTNPQSGVDIVFTNPSQPFTFSNASGSGSFTFDVNNVQLSPGGTANLTGFVNGATYTPVSAPEPSSIVLLGAALLLTPFLRRRIARLA